MANPYSLGADTELPQVDPKMVALGLQAIKKGLVSPQQALAVGKKFSPYAPEDPRINANIAETNADQAQANQGQMMAQAGADRSPASVDAPQLPTLAAKAAKSGLTSKVEAKNTAEQKTTTNQATALDQGTADVLDSRARGAEPFKSLVAGQDQLEQMLKMEQGRPRQFDWGTMDRWAAALNGHPMAPPHVESEDERSKRIMDYAQKLQQDRKSIVDAYLSSVQKQKGGTVINLNGSTQSAGATSTAQDPDMNHKGGSPASQVLSFARQTNTETKDMRSRGELVNTALRLLTSGDPTAQNSLPALSARIIEGTVRPQLAVIAKEGGDSSAWERLNQAFTRVSEGKVTSENAGQYAQMFGELNKQLEAEKSAFHRRAKVTADRIGLSPGEFEDMVGEHWLSPNDVTTKSMLEAAPKPKNVTPMGYDGSAPLPSTASPEDKAKRLEYLKRKAGGG